MKLYAQTLTDYLIENVRPCLSGEAGSHEFRAFFSSFPVDIIMQTGKIFEEFLLDRPQKIKFIFKVGHGLWKHWQQVATVADHSTIASLDAKEWIDKDDKLTFYRNLKLDDLPEYDKLIIILIGIDQARDKASLHDFFRIDARTVWESGLHQSFHPWMSKIFGKYSIHAEAEQFEEIDSLLKQLHRNGAGDLLQVVNFLEQLDFSGIQDGKDALLFMYENLSFWDLPKLKELPYQNRNNLPKYVQDAATFFSYQNFLKSSGRNTAIKQLDRFAEKIQNGSEDISFSEEEFSDVDDLFSCLRIYIERNDPAARERLLQTDFAPIRDKILTSRKKTSGPSRPPSLTKIDAPPLEALLTALWYCFVDFKKYCTKDNLIPAATLQKISIQGGKFRHDLDADIDGIDLLQGCLGGLDALLENDLKIDVEVDEVEKNIPVSSMLLPANLDELRLERAGAGIPGFQFKIVFRTEAGFNIERLFQWQIPETQPNRNLWNMVREIRQLLPTTGPCLPIFTLPFYNELFLASDEEEANRILKLGQNELRVENLLNLPGLSKDNDLRPLINDLSHEFGVFLKGIEEDGFYAAVKDPWRKLYRKYEEIMKSFVQKEGVGPDNPFAPLMYKAFSIISEEDLRTPFVTFLSTAVLTGVHPALLEMVTNRDTFLVHGFLSKILTIINDTSGLKVSLQQWNDVCDLSRINYPLFGLISDASKSLNTKIKSHGLIHCLGDPPRTSAPLSAKMLLRADENDEDNMSDAFLFRENRESRVIKRFLEEYVMIYPHAADGISLAVINPENFQPIIAGINAFLRDQIGKNHTIDTIPPYHFSFTLFASDNQQQEAARHLQEWKKRWELARETPKFSYYKWCRLSIAHRVSHDVDDYMKLISRDDFEPDIAILMSFITAGDVGNDVEQAEPFKVDLDYPLKFPVVETPRCSDEHPARAFVRAKVISNRRFRLATLHSELGVYFKHHDYPLGQEYIVISEGDYGCWRKLIEKLHERATWVVCLDPAIDEKLTRNQDNGEYSPREIIGFSSGVGFRGELNYTLSTERSSLSDVEKEVAKQLNRICGPWEKSILTTTSHCLVSKSRQLSGLSLVRATGPGEKNIRDLISSTLVRITLPTPEENKGILLCDELISLDAFVHWFDTSGDPERPDLLRIVARLQEDGLIVIDAHIVECKLAQENSDHLNKAHIQLESGLRHLMDVFCPREVEISPKFDQRYWWAQLQRLVASKSRVPKQKQSIVTNALEQLGEGKFTICWQAMAVAYWTDSDNDFYELTQQWDFFYKDMQVSIDVISAGAKIIMPICKGEEEIRIPCSGSSLCFPKQTSTYETDVKDIPDTGDAFREINLHDTEKTASLGLESTSQDVSENKVAQGKTNVAEENSESKNIDEKKDNTATITTSLIPERIFLGETLGAVKRDVYWEFGNAQLENRHILIFGKSGVGKTYAIQGIIMELAKQGQHVAIVDYTSGFLKSHLETEFRDTVQPKGHIVKRTPLPINPFRRQQIIIDEDFKDIEDSYSVAGRVTSVFTSVYNSFGDQQKALLPRIIEQGIESYSDGYDFGRLLDDLENDGSTNAMTVANKLTPLGRANLFQGKEKNSWQGIYSDQESKVNIMQLAGLSRDLAKIATEFILWDLYDYASHQGNKEQPLPMVLDEIQNLDHRLDSPLGKFLTEGRKFGLSAILATQTLSNLSQEAQSRLFMASHKLFFRPADTELKEYATLLANATSEKMDIWKNKLVALNKGECYSLGPSLNPKTGKLEEKAFPIRITALSERLVRRND
jgi:DNA phosphorothioation-dependent restriction protein DptH